MTNAPDRAPQPLPPERPLAEHVNALLDALSGRTALAARRFVPVSGARRLAASEAAADNAHQDGEHGQDTAVPAPSQPQHLAVRADEVFPAASLAKLPIAVELLRRADLQQFDLAERFDTAAEPRVGGGGLLDFLDPSTQLTLAELCLLMLAVSDNTVANFLLDFVGMGETNETISRMNLTHTRLARHFMDFAARASHRENTTSANDMLTLLSLVRNSAIPGARRLREMLAAQQLYAELRDWLPPEAQLAYKTGDLDGIVHNAGILTGPAGACVYCVLTAEQRNIPATRTTLSRITRMLWDAWCAN